MAPRRRRVAGDRAHRTRPGTHRGAPSEGRHRRVPSGRSGAGGSAGPGAARAHRARAGRAHDLPAAARAAAIDCSAVLCLPAGRAGFRLGVSTGGRRRARRGRVMGDLALYRRLFRQARPYWLHLAVLFGVGLLASPIALLNPIPLKIAVDSVLGTRPLPRFLHALLPAGVVASAPALLAVAVGLLLAVAALGQLQSLANKFLQAYVGERLVLRFRTQLVQQTQRLSLSYHDSTGSADALYRIQQDASVIDKIMVEGVIPFITAAITLGTMIVVTAKLDGQLALVALAVSPPLYALSRRYRPRMRRQHRDIKKLETSALAVVQETLGALRVVKAFGAEARETDRFAERSREGVAARIRMALMEGRYGLLVGLTTALGTGAVLLIGVQHVRANVLSLGQLLMALTYLGQLYEPLKTVGRKAASLQSYLASAERAFALLDQQPDVPARPDARPLERARGMIESRAASPAGPRTRRRAGPGGPARSRTTRPGIRSCRGRARGAARRGARARRAADRAAQTPARRWRGRTGDSPPSCRLSLAARTTVPGKSTP